MVGGFGARARRLGGRGGGGGGDGDEAVCGGGVESVEASLERSVGGSGARVNTLRAQGHRIWE